MSMKQDVLKCIAKHGKLSASQVQEYLPQYTTAQIKTSCYSLLYEMEIEFFDRLPVRVGRAKPESIYKINKAPVNVRKTEVVNQVMVSHKERKIAVLKKLIGRSGESEKDTLINILHDYGG